jgi:hypothetical protein
VSQPKFRQKSAKNQPKISQKSAKNAKMSTNQIIYARIKNESRELYLNIR